MKTEYLLKREVDQVLYALTPANRLVIQTAMHTGLRVSDVLQLRTEQLKPRFWLSESKTGKKKLVGLPAELLTQLREQAGRNYVFEGRYGEGTHRTRQAVWRDVKRAARAYRLPQNVGPHSFRKYYAVELMRKYGDIDRVRRALNHESATVTTIYALADLRLEAKQRAKKGAKK